MNTRAKWQLMAGLIAAGLMVVVQNAAAGSLEANRTITIHVLNYAKVPHKTLIRAEKVADGVYRHMGVELQWSDDSSLTPEEKNNEKPRGLTDIELSIIPASMSEHFLLAKTVTGLAPGTGPDRTHVYVFYSRVQEVEVEAGMGQPVPVVTCGELLGHAISHEMGHILLNMQGHSETGIMRGKWDLQDLRDAASGTLVFSRDQAEVIRAEVSRRDTVTQMQEIASR